jgi:integrase
MPVLATWRRRGAANRWRFIMESNQSAGRQCVPWNKCKLVGQKAPFKPRDVWAIRARLAREHQTRELALFNLGIDSKLRGCDLVALKLRDIQHGAQIATRAIITQHKTGRPVQFEITPPTRAAVQAWVVEAGLKSEDHLFPSRIHGSPHICSRQYARTANSRARSAIWVWMCMTRSRSRSRRRSEVESVAGLPHRRGGPAMSAVEWRASLISGGATAEMSAEPTLNLRFRP